jgi:hypothetical protein
LLRFEANFVIAICLEIVKGLLRIPSLLQPGLPDDGQFRHNFDASPLEEISSKQVYCCDQARHRRIAVASIINFNIPAHDIDSFRRDGFSRQPRSLRP